MKVLRIVKNILLDLVIVLLLGLVVFNFMNKDKPVPLFKHYFLNVLTGSMEPTIKAGENIIVKECDEYNVNDIVTYKKNDKYVSHRIVAIEGDMIVTKGDANRSNDPPIDKSSIIGKFVFKSKIIDFILKYRIYLLAGVIMIYLSFCLSKVLYGD